MNEKPIILALDASTEACSAALCTPKGASERFAVVPRGHAQHLLGMVDALLREAGLRPTDPDLIVFGRGPGAFTGVRISVAVAQGLAFGAGCPVFGVSTLQALAQGCHRRTGAMRVLTLMDARMDAVYWAPYVLDPQSGLMEVAGSERVSSAEAVGVPSDWSTWAASGTGWGVYRERLSAVAGEVRLSEPQALPRAVDMLEMGRQALVHGRGEPPERAAPVYLRDRVTD